MSCKLFNNSIFWGVFSISTTLFFPFSSIYNSEIGLFCVPSQYVTFFIEISFNFLFLKRLLSKSTNSSVFDKLLKIQSYSSIEKSVILFSKNKLSVCSIVDLLNVLSFNLKIKYSFKHSTFIFSSNFTNSVSSQEIPLSNRISTNLVFSKNSSDSSSTIVSSNSLTDSSFQFFMRENISSSDKSISE